MYICAIDVCVCTLVRQAMELLRPISAVLVCCLFAVVATVKRFLLFPKLKEDALKTSASRDQCYDLADIFAKNSLHNENWRFLIYACIVFNTLLFKITPIYFFAKIVTAIYFFAKNCDSNIFIAKIVIKTLAPGS
jgi:hypothetical protein